MKSLYKLILLFSIASFAQANNKVGNGGDGVFCDGRNGELLDFYENKINLQSDEKNPELIAKKIFEDLKNSAPKMADIYLHRLSELSNEIEYKNDVTLTNIKDSKHLFQPEKNCKILQIAIRKVKILKDEKRFIIQKNLWQKLDPINQAGLLTHEIIYEHLAKLGEEDSVKARKLNSALYNKALSKKEFWEYIKALELPVYP